MPANASTLRLRSGQARLNMTVEAAEELNNVVAEPGEGLLIDDNN
jgi:hypothetical protein